MGDFDPSVVAHQAIPKALGLAGDVEGVWVHTSSISRADEQFASFDGIWCVPASPYANMQGALDAIRYARECGRPFLGTCGGFQHAILEYARNVCGIGDAQHAETHTGAALPLISPLVCSLVEESEEILLVEGSRFWLAYGAAQITEGYHCRYGLNPDYASMVLRSGLQATAYGPNGEVRGIELAGHPFYVAALFQPERRALRGEVPPLVAAFAAAMTAA